MSEYFNKLNYTLANEDTALEYKLLEHNTEHVLCVCGSGSRVLPLFAKFPKHMSLVDFSFEQLCLTKLRIELVRNLSYKEFLLFMGYIKQTNFTKKHRIKIFKTLDLTKDEQKCLIPFFNAINWDGPILYGKYERMLQKISKVIRFFIGSHTEKMMEFKSKEKFDVYYNARFPHIRWKILLFFLGNQTMFNALLYKGNHPKKNIKATYFQYYHSMFKNLFQRFYPRQSFFLQLILSGEVLDVKGAPLEANELIFNNMKKGISECQIDYHQGELISTIEEKIDKKIDFVSFSDILSYFDEETGENYLQRIKDKLNFKAITVHRYYFHTSKNLITSGFRKVTDKCTKLILNEKTQIYLIDIYQRADK